MTKKIPLGIAFAFVLIAVAAAVAITVSETMRQYNSVVNDLPERVEQYNRLSEMDDLVRAEYNGNIDAKVLNSSIARAYIDGLGDEYSRYMTADEYARYIKEENGKKSGTGITAAPTGDGTEISVQSVEAGSPAETAGIVKGDTITAVDGKSVSDENSQKLAKELSAAGKGSIQVEYTHKAQDGSSSSNTVSLQKEYTSGTVFHEVNGECGYIRITGFNDSTPAQFSEALTALKNAEINKVIFDLRGNSSGNIKCAALVTDLIVPLATDGSMSIATVRRANGETVEIFTADATAFSCKAAVLVDSGTAGAAELIACDLRDYGFAVLVGEKTAGRGVMQRVFMLENGDAVLLSVGQITPYTSASYDKIGLTPDFPVALDIQNPDFSKLPHTDDKQYAAALAYLLGK